jgi:hypothetical protein
MDWNQWVNPVAIVAYLFLTIGVLSQIKTTYERESAEDIDMVEVVGRSIAQLMIMWKMVMVGDNTLMIGHAVLMIIYFGYLFLVVKYKYF